MSMGGRSDQPLSNPRVSVVIPVYNVERYLRECLDSVVKQTLRDIEIICVNDCTTDNSQEILNEYAARDARFVLLRHEQNKGLAGARNTGLAVANGEYIFFLDSDDLLASDDALENLYDVAVADDADETVGGVLYWYEDTGEKSMGWHKDYLEREVRGGALEDLPELKSNVVAWNRLMRRDFLYSNEIRFNEVLRKHEDNPFSCQVHVLSKRISILPKTTYIYRQAQRSSLMATTQKIDASYRCAYCQDIVEFIEADESRHKFRKIFYPRCARQLVGSAEILSRFSPTEHEISELMDRWRRVVDLLPHDLPEIPSEQRKALEYIRNGRCRRAWTRALNYYPKEEKKLENLERLNRKLDGQIAKVESSYSWRISRPLRECLRLIRGF